MYVCMCDCVCECMHVVFCEYVYVCMSIEQQNIFSFGTRKKL